MGSDRKSVGLRGFTTTTVVAVDSALAYLVRAEFDWISTAILSLYILASIVFDLQGDRFRRTILGIAACRAVRRGPVRRNRIGSILWRRRLETLAERVEVARG